MPSSLEAALAVGWAPDVLDMLIAAGADPQDVAVKLHGPRQEGDGTSCGVRRPVIEWALRRAVAADPSVEIGQAFR